MLDFETTLTELIESGADTAVGADIKALLTPKQSLIEADDEWKRIVCGGRQWGKSTWAAAAHLLAGHPGATSIALAPKVTKAYDLLLEGYQWLNETVGARVVPHKGDHYFRFPNGGRVLCMGVGTEREADKVRGEKPPFITVEECGTFKAALLEFLIEGCAQPAQAKWFGRGGRGIALIGTPGLRVEDYWHQLCRGDKGGSIHHATVRDNPHIPFPEEYLAWVLKENRWTWETPRFRREYLGQFCADVDSMCYPSAARIQVLPQSMAPAAGYTLMGIDLGATQSPSAWVIIRLTQEVVDGQKRWIKHFIHASAEPTPDVFKVADVTYRLRKELAVQRMRGDSAGLGAMTLETLRTKFKGLPVESAEKPGQKVARIWLLDSMMASGDCRFYDNARSLLEEMSVLPYNEDKDDHHEAYQDHKCDAAHYCIELVQAWTSEQEPKKAAYGSPAWEREQMDRYREQALRRGMGSEEN